MLQIPVIILVVFFISRKPVTTGSITPEFTEAIHWPGCTLDRIKDRSSQQTDNRNEVDNSHLTDLENHTGLVTQVNSYITVKSTVNNTIVGAHPRQGLLQSWAGQGWAHLSGRSHCARACHHPEERWQRSPRPGRLAESSRVQHHSSGPSRALAGWTEEAETGSAPGQLSWGVPGPRARQVHTPGR